MAQTLLVTIDIPLGTEVLAALDVDGLNPSIAVWVYLSDYEDWRLLLASPHWDGGPIQRSYGMVFRAFEDAGISRLRAPEIMICRMSDPFIKALQQRYAKLGDVRGMRVGGDRFGERYVEDGYEYRIV